MKSIKTTLQLSAALAALVLCAGPLSAQEAMKAQAKPDAKAATTAPNLAKGTTLDSATGLIQADKAASAKIEVGKPAVDFELKGVDGKQHKLSEFVATNKAVVLIWSNPDCPIYSRVAEEGTINKLAEKYKDQKVKFVQIDSTAAHQVINVKAGNDKFKYTGLSLTDFDGKVGHLYNAKTTPDCYVINNTGTLVYYGAIDNDPNGAKPIAERTNYVDAALTASLKGEKPKVQTSTSYGCSIKYGTPSTTTQPSN